MDKETINVIFICQSWSVVHLAPYGFVSPCSPITNILNAKWMGCIAFSFLWCQKISTLLQNGTIDMLWFESRLWFQVSCVATLQCSQLMVYNMTGSLPRIGFFLDYRHESCASSARYNLILGGSGEIFLICIISTSNTANNAIPNGQFSHAMSTSLCWV